MSLRKSTCRFLILLAAVGMVLPRPMVYSQQIRTASLQRDIPEVRDVSLNSNGILNGTVVDAQGQPAPGCPIMIQQGDAPIAQTVTNNEGQFAVASLRGGLYQVAAGNRMENVRVWTAATAPPAATEGYAAVVGNVARGQIGCTGTPDCSCTSCCGGGPLSFLMHPLVIGAAVAAAIAIPLAVNDDDDTPASP